MVFCPDVMPVLGHFNETASRCCQFWHTRNQLTVTPLFNVLERCRHMLILLPWSLCQCHQAHHLYHRNTVTFYSELTDCVLVGHEVLLILYMCLY